jgi:excisionase family DNA binding protein
MSTENVKLLRPEDCCEWLSLPRTTIFRLIRSGEIESLKIGKRRLIPSDAITDYIERARRAHAGG